MWPFSKRTSIEQVLEKYKDKLFRFGAIDVHVEKEPLPDMSLQEVIGVEFPLGEFGPPELPKQIDGYQIRPYYRTGCGVHRP